MSSFTEIIQFFGNIFTNIYFQGKVSLAASESTSYRSIKNPLSVTSLVSIIETCFFLTTAVFTLKEFSIKDKRKEVNTGFLVL